MDIANLWTAWPIAGPWSLSSLQGGTNSVVWRADAADGQAYVLRISPDSTSIPRVRYETALLQALSDKGLPFRLPLPLMANNGDVIVPFEQEQGTHAFAMLYPLLPGNMHDRPPERNDLVMAAHAGSMLAVLDNALATLPDIPFPHGFTPPPPFRELASMHPLVPDPLAAIEQLPIEREQARQLRAMLSDVIERVPHLYNQLPQQLLHRDYDPGNILVEDRRVIAVLDFEFAGRDIRVLDLCVALSWWPVNLLGTGKEWELIDIFGVAYLQQVVLSEDELLAIPTVLRLRDAASFVHRLGRYLAGMETESRMQDRVQHSLWREAWLSTHQETLLEHGLAWK